MENLIRKVILILEDEVKQGYLTEREFDDYISLIRHAAEKIFEKHAQFRKEVDRVTKPLIELPSVREKRLLAEKDAVIADKNAAIADKDAKLADKDAEIARMQALLEKYHIPVTS